MREKLTVGQLIRRKRKSLGCSQEAIAEHLGVSIKFISLVEAGERQLVVDHFQKVSEFLGIPLKDFLIAKVFDEQIQIKMKKLRKELLDSGTDEVQKAIELAKVKELRAREICDLLRYYEMQKEEYTAQIKAATAHRTSIERQMQLLNEEKHLLGFGQMAFEFKGER